MNMPITSRSSNSSSATGDLEPITHRSRDNYPNPVAAPEQSLCSGQQPGAQRSVRLLRLRRWRPSSWWRLGSGRRRLGTLTSPPDETHCRRSERAGGFLCVWHALDLAGADRDTWPAMPYLCPWNLHQLTTRHLPSGHPGRSSSDHRAPRRRYPGATAGGPAPSTEPRYVDAFEAILADPNQLQAVAILGDEVIGALQLHLHPRTGTHRRLARADRGGPHCRRRTGLGRRAADVRMGDRAMQSERLRSRAAHDGQRAPRRAPLL